MAKYKIMSSNVNKKMSYFEYLNVYIWFVQLILTITFAMT